MCRTCGYLLPRGQQNQITRPGPPEDDLGLLLNQRQRHNRRTVDGIKIYKNDEIKSVLKIGIGGNTKYCPFDCQCCF